MSSPVTTLTQLVRIATCACICFSGGVWAHHTPEEKTEVQKSVGFESLESGASSVDAGSAEERLASEFQPLSLLHESMWQRLESEFEFTSIDNPRVDKQIEFFQAGTRSLRSNLVGASPYLFHIAEQLAIADIPSDLVLLPLVESGFNPVARSPMSAVGIWQFIPRTARHYGLTTGKKYDQRKDVIASTTAAVRYLKDLNGMFDGDWLLSLAAYNTGPGNVRSAMRRAVKQGKEPSYWNLKLSTETLNYVPRLIAAAKIISNPAKYGITLPTLANRRQIESVAVGRRISLSQISDLTDVSLKQITELNLGLHEGLTPPNGPHTLTLPIEATQPLLTALKKLKRQPLVQESSALATVSREVTDAFVIDSTLTSAGTALESDSYKPFKTYRYKTHVVKRGDSLWKISRGLSVDVASLREWNNLQEGQRSIQVGDELRVAALETEDIDVSEVPLLNYRVLSTDTLPTIADKFDLQIAVIKKWNKSLWLKDHVQAGQVIKIPY